MALAHAARALGVPCEVFMPAEAPLTKIEGAEALGAEVVVGGDSVDDCLVDGDASAPTSAGMAFVHPFDDPDVVAGQGTLGLELLDDVPDLAKVVVPIGGGGLAVGRRDRGQVARGRRSRSSASRSRLRAVRGPARHRPLTIADGIAVKRPGELTRRSWSEWLDDVVIVSEEEIAEAMVLLMEKAKLVVEGAGAVGVAALLAGARPPAAATARPSRSSPAATSTPACSPRSRAATRPRRAAASSCSSRIARPPGRARAAARRSSATSGANLIEVQHVREGVDLHVRETAVELVLETRGRDHADAGPRRDPRRRLRPARR